jgi:hypothetical protein
MNPYGRPTLTLADRLVRLETGEVRYRFGTRLVRESELREDERLKVGLGVSRPRRLRAMNYYLMTGSQGGREGSRRCGGSAGRGWSGGGSGAGRRGSGWRRRMEESSGSGMSSEQGRMCCM